MKATLLAGFADKNASLFRRLGIALGDPAAWLEFGGHCTALVRDLEMDRVRHASHADHVTCPAEHEPPLGLSADRETAVAQAVVQILRSKRIEHVTVDRTLPYIFAWHLEQAEIEVEYDSSLGVTDRRVKSDHEIECLAKAQSVTEDVMRRVCEKIARASVNDNGELHVEGTVLTSESLRRFAAIEFLMQDFSMTHGAIVASAPEVADCHHSGTGPLKTGSPVIVDLFPRDNKTLYNGDCTRTVVHGSVSPAVLAMHVAVLAAKAAAQSQLVAGATGDAVHIASEQTLIDHGYRSSRGKITEEASIQHGTGHGVGLDVHEPILLDFGGEEIFEGEVFTVEPGLYGGRDGGVRIEDMLVVTEKEPRNLNSLHMGLDWLS